MNAGHLALASLLFAALPVAAEPAAKPEKFGAALSARAAVPLKAVLDDPAKFADKVVTVDGKVRASCTRKGCWMELAPTGDKGPPGCRVTFKDYGFFVPLDARGATARVEGQVAVKVIPKEEVAHLESEGGSFTKAADGTAREVRIVATGVELRR